MQTVYKVVHRHLGETRYSSCYAAEDFKLLYKIGAKTIARTGKLFAFKSLRSARAFRAHHRKSHILRCEATSVQEPAFKRIPNNTHLPSMRLFWEARNRKCFTWEWPTLMPVPKGTVLCKSVKPIAVCEN